MTCYDFLRKELKNPLPGETFQVKMAPVGRFIPRDVAQSKIKAAVAIVLYERTSKTVELALIKRTIYDGPHSGQVSFPGGKADPDDKSLIETAIRETYEEIGIQLNIERILGNLSPIHIVVSGFEVHPFVFCYESIPDFKLDFKEVQYVINVPLERLIDETVIKETEINIRGQKIRTPFFDISGEIVWGATSMILSEFIEILKRVKTKNPVCF